MKRKRKLISCSPLFYNKMKQLVRLVIQVSLLEEEKSKIKLKGKEEYEEKDKVKSMFNSVSGYWL